MSALDLFPAETNMQKSVTQLEKVAGSYEMPQDLAESQTKVISNWHEYHQLVKTVIGALMEQRDHAVKERVALEQELIYWETSLNPDIAIMKEEMKLEGYQQALDQHGDPETPVDRIHTELEAILSGQMSEDGIWKLARALADSEVLMNDEEAQYALAELYHVVHGDEIQVYS